MVGRRSPCFVVGRQVKRERELDAVCSFVSHKLFGNAMKLRRRIGKVSDRLFVRAIRRADKIIGRLGGALMAGKELRAIVGEKRHDGLILAIAALKDALRFQGVQVKAIQERELAFL